MVQNPSIVLNTNKDEIIYLNIKKNCVCVWCEGCEFVK